MFSSGREARAINLDRKNMKIDIFTGGTSVRSKNIFTAILRYSTGKHEINDRVSLTQTDRVADSEEQDQTSSMCRLILLYTFRKVITISRIKLNI